jgi:hypothetical protein
VKPTEKTSVQKTAVQKTNAARLLDRMGIRYELREYEVDPNDLAAETVAPKSVCRRSGFSRLWGARRSQ